MTAIPGQLRAFFPSIRECKENVRSYEWQKTYSKLCKSVAEVAAICFATLEYARFEQTSKLFSGVSKQWGDSLKMLDIFNQIDKMQTATNRKIHLIAATFGMFISTLSIVKFASETLKAFTIGQIKPQGFIVNLGSFISGVEIIKSAFDIKYSLDDWSAVQVKIGKNTIVDGTEGLDDLCNEKMRRINQKIALLNQTSDADKIGKLNKRLTYWNDHSNQDAKEAYLGKKMTYLKNQIASKQKTIALHVLAITINSIMIGLTGKDLKPNWMISAVGLVIASLGCNLHRSEMKKPNWAAAAA